MFDWFCSSTRRAAEIGGFPSECPTVGSVSGGACPEGLPHAIICRELPPKRVLLQAHVGWSRRGESFPLPNTSLAPLWSLSTRPRCVDGTRQWREPVVLVMHHTLSRWRDGRWKCCGIIPNRCRVRPTRLQRSETAPRSPWYNSPSTGAGNLNRGWRHFTC